MAGPRQLWKTTIVIWSVDNPKDVDTKDLIQEGIDGLSYIAKEEHELIASPYSQPDGPPEEFFEMVGEDEDDPH